MSDLTSKRGQEYPATFRQEIIKPLFSLFQSGESGTVAGVASMGKSRLLQFILRADVQQHYLGDDAQRTLFVWVDCNRLAELSEWGLYELILTALAEAVDKEMRAPLLDLRHEAIMAHKPLLAQRNVEMALRQLCHEEGLRIALILDEFDEAYRELPMQTIANLRALRDMNKYVLCYILFMRDEPAEIRSVAETEHFYELVSRAVIGLTPHTPGDTRRIVAVLLERRRHELPATLPAETTDQLVTLSGGHPGFLVALVDSLADGLPLEQTWESWAQHLPKLQEECRKIWHGLREEEQHTLSHLAQGINTGFRDRHSLELKGLLQDAGQGNVYFFSSIFQYYVANQASFDGNALRVDTVARNVYIEGQPPVQLTAKEYELVAYLYEHEGEVRSNSDIVEALYPGDEQFAVNDSNIAALVRRARKKVELDPANPQYVHNVRGRGYRLTVEPDAEKV